MRKKVFGKLLSVVLSVAMALTTLSVPSYAVEGESFIEVETEEEESFLEEDADVSDVVEAQMPEETVEADAEEVILSDEEATEEVTTDAETAFDGEEIEVTEEVAEEVTEGEADAEASFDAKTSNDVAVNFHSNYSGKDKVVKKSYAKTSTSETAIDVTTIFAAADIGAADKFEGWALGDLVVATISEKDIVSYATEKSLATVDVYAQWVSLGKYTVTYDANWPASSIASDRYDYASEPVTFDVSEPFILSGSEFYCRGYALSGWKYEDAKGKTVTVKTAAATLKSIRDTDGAAVTIQAQWKPVSYTLTFDANGGKFAKGIKSKITYKVEEKTRKRTAFPGFKLDESGNAYLDKNQTDITRTGYTFEGWNGTSDAYAYYGDTQFANYKFTARWSANPVTLKYDPNGGYLDVYDKDTYEWVETTTEPVLESSYYSSSIWGSAKVPHRYGYTFKGWKATMKGKAKLLPLEKYTYVKDLDIPSDSVVVLTAEWEAYGHKLSFDLMGGKAKKLPTTYKTGDNTVIPKPTKDGFEFGGWMIYGDGYEYEEETVLTEDSKIRADISDNLYFYANWNPVTFNIEFYNNDGTKKYDEWDTCYYDQPLNFTNMARVIEEASDFDATTSIKGFATSKGSNKVNYELNKDYVKIAGKAANADGSAIVVKFYAVTSPKVYRIDYLLDGGTIGKGAVYTYSGLTKPLAIKATATKPGLTFKGWTTESDSDKIVWDSTHTYVTAIAAGATENVFLTAVYVDMNKYTITLVPNGKGIKDAKGNEVAAAGVQYKVGDVSEFTFYNNYEAPDEDELGWSREGYDFIGFGTTAKSTEPIGMLSELGNGKATNVKLYGIWIAHTNYIYFSHDANVYRNGVLAEDAWEPDYKISPSFVKQVYGGKAVTLSKLTADGYTFLGWQVNGDVPSGAKFVYTDSTNKYIKAIAGDNDANSLILVPAFEENSYSIYVDPNGGRYNEKSGKQLLAKVYYTEYIENYIEDVFQNSAKAGCTVSTVSLTKNNKSFLRYKFSDGSIGYNRHYGMSTKNGASVVLYPIYYKMNMSSYKPTASATISDTTLSMGASYWYSSDEYVLQFEYSNNAYFMFNTHRLDVVKTGMVSTQVTAGKDYYVRVRIGRLDSTGQYVYGPWSKTARATKPSK